MKIIFLSHFDANLYLFRLPIMKALVKEGWEVVALTPQGEYSSRFEKEGIRYISYEIDRGSLNPLKELKTIYDIAQKLRKISPDIVHTFTAKPNIYGNIAAKIAGIKTCISSVTGLGSFFIEDDFKSKIVRFLIVNLYKLVFRFSKTVIFQNSDDLKLFVSKNIVKKEKTALIKGSGIDTKEWVSSKDVLSSSPKKILFIGRLLIHKGIGEFIESAKEVKKIFKEGTLFIVAGDFYKGNPYNIDKKAIQNAIDEGTITFLGWREDIKELLDDSYIFVLPSYREGLPRTAIEAASMSKPIITTKTVGCKEAVDDGYNGFLTPLKNHTEITKAIIKLLEDKNLYTKMSQNSRKKALKEFDIEVIVKNHIDIYKQQ